MHVRGWYSALLLCAFCFSTSVFAGRSPADSLELRVRNAAERGAVADNLGAAFYARPGGEVLLLPPNKDLRFAILIYNIDILPDRAQFSAGLAFRDGRSNQLVAFKTDNILFYYKQGLTGPVRMQLMSNVLLRLGRAATVQFMGGYNQTWAEFDCGGLKQFGITAEARINNNVLVPVDAQQKTIPDSSITSRIKLQVKSWDELLVSISLNPFQIKGFEGYVFNISKATLDLSGDMNAEGMQLPDNYRDPGFDASWEGFYLAEGKLLFPKKFASDSLSAALSFRNLILDETGFSANITGERILSPEKGNLAGWRFGIDKASISFYRNCLSKAELQGPLGLPVLPDSQYLQYQALLGFEDEYSFRVFTRDTLSFPALKAGKVRLDPGSQVYLGSVRGEIKAEALLHGLLSISIAGNTAEKSPAAGFNGIAFQGLSVSNTAPKLYIAYLGIARSGETTQRVSSFPVMIHSVGARTENDQIHIQFGLGLNLSEKIGCSTRFSLITAFKSEQRTDRWLFVRVRLDDISLRAEIANIRFNGRISMMRNDPVYGDGFSGAIEFGVKIASQKVQGVCSAIFGNVNLNRYWYFDASLRVTERGIPLASAISLNGFLGGAWNRTRVLRPEEKAPSENYGKSANGRVYVPDATAGMGLRAGVFLNSTAKGAFESHVVLEMQFYKGGGLASVSMLGTADFFMKPVPANQQKFIQQSQALCGITNPRQWVSQYRPKGQVAAALEMVLDFDKETYNADLGMYVNLQSQSMGVSGRGNNGFAGQVNLYFSPTNWYVWIGNSLHPLAVRAIVPKLLNADASAYFMAGTYILPAPPLPEIIQKSVGGNVIFERNTELISKGVGFALGANLKCDIGGDYSDRKLAIYASGSAIAGFDILLQQYHNSVYCKQTGETPGVNGWFAQGKYYVGAALNLGVSIKEHKIQIANMSVGAVLYGQGPNPVYAEGMAGININTVLLKYNGNIRLQLGNKCDLSETKYNSIPIITIAEPAQGRDVSVLTRPAVNYALPVMSEFQDVDQRRLRFAPDFLFMRDNLKVAGQWVVSAGGEKAVFQSAEPLQPFSSYTLLATIYLEAWIPSKSAWQRIKQSGSEIVEQMSLRFTTGGLPREIPLSNITAAYPHPGQVNMHREYSRKGFVELKVPHWQSLTLPGTRIVARFSAQNGECRETLTEIRGNTARFEIPVNLSNDKVYRFSLVRQSSTQPLVNIASGNQEGQGSLKNVTLGSGLFSSAAASGNMQKVDRVDNAVLLSYLFRTSVYAQPAQKWISCNVRDTAVSGADIAFDLQQAAGEYLESAELRQYLSLSVELKRNTWFNRSVYPFLYGYYYKLPPALRSQINWGRDTTGGLIPRKPQTIEQAGIDRVELKTSHFTSGKYVFDKTAILLTFNGPRLIESDLTALRQSLTAMSAGMDRATLEMLTAGIPAIQNNQSLNSVTKPLQAPVLGNGGLTQPVPVTRIGSLIAQQAAARNRFLMALNTITIPSIPKGSVIPFSGIYKISDNPAVPLAVGKGGIL